MDRSKSLEELTGEVWGPTPDPDNERQLVRQRYEWYRTPLNKLSDIAIIRFLKVDPTWSEFLVPEALERLKDRYEPSVLLCQLLSFSGHDWMNHPDDVRLLRSYLFRAMRDLEEWDGTPEIAKEANEWLKDLNYAWARFEYRISAISDE